MKRKVIQIAGSTQLVSLPRQWAKRNDVQKGSELDVQEQGNKVIISANGPSTKLQAKVNIDAFGRLGLRPVRALIKNGYDEVHMSYSDPKINKLIEEMLPSMIGVEIISQTDKSCVIRQISHAQEAEFDSVLMRTFLLLFSIADECAQNMKEGNHAQLAHAKSRDVTINKLTNFCRRILHKHGYSDFHKTPSLYYIVEEMENLGDEYKELSEFLFKKKIITKNQDIVKIFEDLNGLLRLFVSLFNKFQNKQAKEFALLADDAIDRIDEISEKASVDEIRVLESLRRIRKIIFNLSGPLMAMRIPDMNTDYLSTGLAFD